MPERRRKSMPNSKLTKKEKLEPTNWNETYDDIDVDLCIPHPSVLQMRFDYQSEALEQNIKENGQLEPCRAIRDEDGMRFLVYIGQRRMLAVRNLKVKYGVPSTIKVIIDEDDVSEDELIKRAIAENIDESGQRLPLSDLEKIAYCKDLLQKYDGHQTERILTSAGLERSTAKKILFLVDKLDKAKIDHLHKIEGKSNFTFRIAHLDLLLASEDERNFYETASLAAFSQKPPEEIKTLRQVAGHFSKDIPWFKEIFPEFANAEDHRQEKEHTGNRARDFDYNDSAEVQEETDPERGGDGETATNDTDPGENVMGALPEPMIIILCHYCKALNTFKLRTGSPEFIFCNLKEGGSIEQFAIGANAVFDCERECSACQKSFWVTASVLEGGKIVVETSNSRIIALPKEEASVRKVYWDQGVGMKNQGGSWMLYDEAEKKKYRLDAANGSERRRESSNNKRSDGETK